MSTTCRISSTISDTNRLSSVMAADQPPMDSTMAAQPVEMAEMVNSTGSAGVAQNACAFRVDSMMPVYIMMHRPKKPATIRKKSAAGFSRPDSPAKIGQASPMNASRNSSANTAAITRNVAPHLMMDFDVVHTRQNTPGCPRSTTRNTQPMATHTSETSTGSANTSA